MGKGIAVAVFPLAGLAFIALMLMAPVTTDMPAVKVSAIPGEFCKTIEVPASDEEFYTVWRAPRAATITEIYCEGLNGTSVGFDFEIDDGSPTSVINIPHTGVTCLVSGQTFTSFVVGEDHTFDEGDRLDLVLYTVTGDVDSFSACLRYILD